MINQLSQDWFPAYARDIEQLKMGTPRNSLQEWFMSDLQA